MKGALKMAYVRKCKNKKGELYFKIKVSCGYDGKKQRTHSMTYYPISTSERQIKKEVNEQAVLFELKCRSGTIPKRRLKFSELCEQYLEFEKRKNSLAKGTYEDYLGYRKRTYQCIGDMFIDKIKRADIQAFVFDLSDGSDGGKPLATKTQKNYVSFVSAVFNYAVKNELLTKNPCILIEYIEKPKKPRQYYTVEEYKAILQAFEENNAVLHHRVFFMFLIYLGLRRGEALAIRWDDIKDDSVFIERSTAYNNSNTGIYDKKTKTEESKRTLKLPKEIIDILPLLKQEQEEYKAKNTSVWQDSNRLFCNEIGGPIFPDRPYKYLKEFFEKNNLVFKGLHSCRHSAISYLLHNNIAVPTVSRIAGHANGNVTMSVYEHEIKEATVYGCDVMSKLLQDNNQ